MTDSSENLRPDWNELKVFERETRVACDYPWTTRNNAHHIHTCSYEWPHHPGDAHHVCLCGATLQMTDAFYRRYVAPVVQVG